MVLAASLVACSSAGNGAGPSGSGGVDASADGTATETVDGGQPDSTSMTGTQIVGTAGGTVTAAGITLAIPAGALPTDTVIVITPDAGPIPTGYTGLSSLYSFAPSGTVFLEPVTVTFTLTSPGTSPTVFWSNTQGGYDALATTTTATTASASITHFSQGFCGEGHGGADGGGTGHDSGTGTTDAGAVDAATTPDAEVADSGSTGAAEAGTSEAGTPEAGAPDASAPDASAADSGAPGDAGTSSITVTIDGVVTTFATGATDTYANGISTLQADESAQPTRWHLSLVVGTVAQEACGMPTYPIITYTHYTSGVVDSVFSTNLGLQQACSFLVNGTATMTGQVSRGTFSGILYEALDAGTTKHTLSAGSYDVVY
jgi:hypothetical protein